MKRFCLLYFIAVLFLPQPTLSQDLGRIKISTSEIGDKPYPTIIYYCSESLDTIHGNLFVYTFKVSEPLLRKLEKIIVDAKMTTDDELVFPTIFFQISIAGKDTILRGYFKRSVFEIFKTIGSVYDLEDRETLLSVLSQLARRLQLPDINRDNLF